ncbi:hypothetical protein K402DRAFT_446535 [Aulographum hederae CBS 113979]|uniref:Uncharacterized protein n=1 Tax=Aulographum hederae CBS 113979 TaxID=1176131 RepID=A0A6G1GZR7_9PEZI|nr:hypothetical protein K402DRAFT_446535 [Aulographum hederae CBS 113979]
MSIAVPRETQSPRGFKARLAGALRRKSKTQPEIGVNIRPVGSGSSSTASNSSRRPSRLTLHDEYEDSEASTLVESRRPDMTALLHGLSNNNDSLEELNEALGRADIHRKDGEPEVLLDAEGNPIPQEVIDASMRRIDSLSPELWKYASTFMSPHDAASLVMANKIFLNKLGKEPLETLNEPDNFQHKTLLLSHYDYLYPLHLLCPQCAIFHRRTRRGDEKWKAEYTLNPLFNCPKTRDTVLPRTRVVHGRYLPFHFAQLVLRARKFGDPYGIPIDRLSRRINCADSKWNHTLRFHIFKGHLLMRSVSSCIADPNLTATAERMLLYDRMHFTPYFSVCAHWRDGDLMKLTKCALSHIPRPPQSVRAQLKQGPKVSLAAMNPNFIVRGCEQCRPMHRCPECPSEYLIEVRMVEDKSPDAHFRFRHAIVVTRWADLGDGKSPYREEWAACNDELPEGERTVCGIFEAGVGNEVPGSRVLNLNPKGQKKGEEGHNWY